MKAGLLEVADLHVVNKADRKDAHRTTVELRAMLRLGGPRQPGQWHPNVLETIALNGTGISELADELARHQAWLSESGELDRRLLTRGRGADQVDREGTATAAARRPGRGQPVRRAGT